MRDDEAAVRAVLEDVVNPLLRTAGAGVELVELTEDTLTLRLLGEAAFGPGAALLREDVVEAALASLRGARALAYESGAGEARGRDAGRGDVSS